jgi:hypothetical protein
MRFKTRRRLVFLTFSKKTQIANVFRIGLLFPEKVVSNHKKTAMGKALDTQVVQLMVDNGHLNHVRAHAISEVVRLVMALSDATETRVDRDNGHDHEGNI